MPGSMPAAITFDFHNTIAHCDAWFTLETKTLIADWLTWYGARHQRTIPAAHTELGTTAFREMRDQIKRHGREMTATASVTAIAARLGIPTSPDEIESGIKWLMRRALADLQPVPGAIDTVRQLAAAGYPLGIISSAIYHPFLLWALAQFGIADAFAIVTTSASAGFYKSRPEIFWQTLTAIGADPLTSLHVGDSYRFDVDGAHRAGMRAVWLAPAGAEAVVDGHPPELVLASLINASPKLIDLLAAPRS